MSSLRLLQLHGFLLRCHQASDGSCFAFTQVLGLVLLAVKQGAHVLFGRLIGDNENASDGFADVADLAQLLCTAAAGHFAHTERVQLLTQFEQLLLEFI